VVVKDVNGLCHMANAELSRRREWVVCGRYHFLFLWFFGSTKAFDLSLKNDAIQKFILS